MNFSSPDASSIALSIDELRWLHASAAMDPPVQEKYNNSFELASARSSIPEVIHDLEVQPTMHPIIITPPMPIPMPSPPAKSLPKLEWTTLTDLSNVTTNSSPPSSFKGAAPVSKLSLATHIHPLRVQTRAPNTNRHFHLVDSPPASSMRLPYAPSGSVTRLPSSPSSPTTPVSPSRIPVLSQPSRSPLTPISRSLHIKHPEWIYRHPKPRTASNGSPPPSPSPRPRTRSTSSRQRPRPQTGYHPPGSSHARSHSHPHSPQVSITVPNATPSTPPSGVKGSPFWSSFLRPRPRARRSIPSLKGVAVAPSKIPIPISASAPIPPPLPPKSTSRPPSHQRTPSESSTASSASTNTATICPAAATPHTPAPRSRSHSSSSSSSSSSNSNYSSSSTTATSATSSAQPETPTTPPSLYSPSSPYSNQHPETQSECLHPPLSSSYPIPSKSILTRASSVSTKNSTSTSLSSCSAAKSVTFVDVPTVHYHEGVGDWDVIEEEDTKFLSENSNTNGIHDMGVDVDSMDMDMDSSESYASSNLDDPEGSTEMYLRGVRMRDVCATPTPASVRGRGRGRLEKDRALLKLKGKEEAREGQAHHAKGLKRLMSLTRGKSPASTSRSTSTSAAAAAATRPTISGPFPLGTHVAPQSLPLPQSPPLSPAHPPAPSSTLLSSCPSHSNAAHSTTSLRSSLSNKSQSRSMYTRSRQPYVKSHLHPQPQTYSYAHPPKSNRNENIPKSKTGFSSLPTLAGSASASLRHVPSLESFRSAAGRSVRSLGSVKSTASTRGFRSWLSKFGSGIGIGPVTWEG